MRAFQHNPLADHSRSSFLVNFFGAGAWMAIEGAVGLGMAGRGATLVLHTSWFNCSSWIRAKEITTVRVYGCRAFTSPRIFDFRPSIKNYVMSKIAQENQFQKNFFEKLNPDESQLDLENCINVLARKEKE
ncbi:hypothetical protein GW17_00042525 [Ensete ventricosum]|nr:hypothetical protein GW17_00042525 [Ensete ventricosum]